MARTRIVRPYIEYFRYVVLDRQVLELLYGVAAELGPVSIHAAGYRCDTLQDVYAAPVADRFPLSMVSKRSTEKASDVNYLTIEADPGAVRVYVDQDTDEMMEKLGRIQRIMARCHWKDAAQARRNLNGWFRTSLPIGILGSWGFMSMVVATSLRVNDNPKSVPVAHIGIALLVGALWLVFRVMQTHRTISALPQVVLCLEEGESPPAVQWSLPKWMKAAGAVCATTALGTAVALLVTRLMS